MLQGWTSGHNHITLYMLTRVTDDVHEARVKCWPQVAGTMGSRRLTAELCLP